MKKIFILLLLSLPLLAGNMQLQSGSVLAHAEMVFDKEINPKSDSLSADITISKQNIESLSGRFWIELPSFASDKSDRDEHMQKSLNSKEFMLTSFTIDNVTTAEGADMYVISGKLQLHGQERPLSAKAKIILKDGMLSLEANTTIIMPEYGIEMPCMMFMCVNDDVDLTVKATFKE